MDQVWFLVAVLQHLALLATLLSIWLGMSPALSGLSSALLNLFSARQSAPRF